MSVEVQFAGGPAGGTYLVIPGDPMNPPKVYTEIVSAQNGSKPVYRRVVNSGDDGPLWRYVFEGEEPTA